MSLHSNTKIVLLLLQLLLLISIMTNTYECLHISGEWNSSNFFVFLAKFGVQKTVLENKPGTRGYIYGNISQKHQNMSGTLVVVDSEYFMEFYNNASKLPRQKACHLMFEKINKMAWHKHCNPNGKEDFLRSVPCPNNGLCIEEDNPARVIHGAQLTYAIQDVKQPRYWYVSLVSCRRNASSCQWQPTMSHAAGKVRYDLWLVNGAPSASHVNKLEHQFSFEQHDLIEIYFIFMLIYVSLALACHAKIVNIGQPITCCLVCNCWLEAFGSFLCVLHLAVFAGDGVGLGAASVTGEWLRMMADSLLLLTLILCAKFGLTGRPNKLASALAAAAFGIVTSGLYFWSLADVSVVEDVGQYDTVPACLLLALRFPAMFYFLSELRQSSGKYFAQIDIVHFAAGFLLWMLALPMLVLISETQVSALWRVKCVLSVGFAVNFCAAATLAYCLFSVQDAGADSAKYDFLIRHSGSETEDDEQENGGQDASAMRRMRNFRPGGACKIK